MSTLKKLVVSLMIIMVLLSGFSLYTVRESYDKGYSAGYIEGAKDGAGTGYTIRDPTYAEMIAFLAADNTDKNVYDSDTYNCYDYTRDVCTNAFNQGYRAGFVYLYFKESAHALVCFNTVDKGLIYIEPQYDVIVNVDVGIRYWTDVPGVTSPFDDTILRFGIIW